MAFDQSSVPIELKPINVARVLPEESHITATGRNIEGFVVATQPCPSPTPIYYPAPLPDSGGFIGREVNGNMNQGVANWSGRMPVSNAVGINPASKCSSSAGLVQQASSGELRRNDSGGSVSGKKPKILCSFGGTILRRPGDGALRYVGGVTRLLGFKGNIDFDKMVKKLVEICPQDFIIKYQLPGEDLDTLVSVTSQDEFDIMMEEYDKIIESSPDGTARLRLYLFSASDVKSVDDAMLRDFKDSEELYTRALNGIVLRKESLDSGTSAQNLDLGANGTVDRIGQHGQGSVVGPRATGQFSPVGNSGGVMSQENSPKVLAMEPFSSYVADVSTVRVGIPVVQLSNSEIEVEKSMLPTTSQQMNSKQSVPTHYIRAGLPHQPDVQGPIDSQIYASQVCSSRSQLVGTPGSVSQQHQLLENAASASPKHFISAMHTAGTHNVILRPNAVQQLMHPSHFRQDNYPEGASYPMRVVQVPMDRSYSAYPTQVPSPMIGGPYGWNVATPHRTLFHEVLMPPQQVMGTNTVTRLDDCYMCQKALPHAHSDSLAQQLTDGIDSPTSDSNRAHHSLQPEVNLQAQPSTMTRNTGASRDVSDEHSSVTQRRALNPVDHQVATPVSPLGISHGLDTQIEHDRTCLPKTENLGVSKMLVPQGVIVSAVPTPYSAPVNNLYQACPDTFVQQHSAQTQFQAKQNALVNNMPAYSEPPPVITMPSPTLTESPNETLGRPTVSFPMVDILNLSTDNLKQDSTEPVGVRTLDNIIDTESRKFDGPLKSDMLDQKPQQNAGRDVYVDSIFDKGNVAFDSNQIKPSEIISCLASEVSYTSQPTEYYVKSPQPIIGDVVERTSAGSVWKDDASQFQLTESVTLNGNASSSILPANMIEGVLQASDSLISSQDPRTLNHDMNFAPPRPNKSAAKNDADNQDLLSGAYLKSSEEVSMQLLLDNTIQLPSANMISDSNLDHEFIGQELQAVAEGVTASVLHVAPPLNTNLPSDGNNELLFKPKREREEKNKDLETQESPKLGEFKVKLPEKLKFGFPTSDIGRLQIINNKDLEELRELGSGTFGTVYHGKWRGSDVAIKRINDRCFSGKPSEQERMRDDFWNEAIKLADLHHPNVLAFYGVVLDGPGGSVATVTEYMVNGSLRHALQKNERTLDKRKRILIAMDVAFGMEYLHGKNIVHFDLKSDNLLVNLRDPHRPICKVGDLGLSKVKCHTLISGGVRGTLPWMAPELLNGSSSLVSEKVDVFSFGIVMWELITGEEPYAELHYGAIIGGIVSNTLRPAVPESCDPEWRSLMEKCWSLDPQERPSFTEIANQLRAMGSKISPKGQNSMLPLPPK